MKTAQFEKLLKEQTPKYDTKMVRPSDQRNIHSHK